MTPPEKAHLAWAQSLCLCFFAPKAQGRTMSQANQVFRVRWARRIYCATASRLRAKSLRWSKFFFFDDKLLLPFPFSYISAYQARFSILHQGFGFTRSSTSTLQSPASGNLPLLHQPTIYLFLAVSKVIVSPLALEAGIILNSIFRIMRVPSRLSEQQEVQSSFCHRDH